MNSYVNVPPSNIKMLPIDTPRQGEWKREGGGSRLKSSTEMDDWIDRWVVGRWKYLKKLSLAYDQQPKQMFNVCTNISRNSSSSVKIKMKCINYRDSIDCYMIYSSEIIIINTFEILC